MFHFDRVLVMAVNQYSQHSWLFDRAVSFTQGLDLLKGGIFMTAFWWAWFAYDGEAAKKRNVLIVTMAGAFLAMALARGLAMVLPFQMRPAHDPAIAFRIPYGIKTALETWSSFPSDHAALFSALVTGLWLVSRRLGLAAGAYMVGVILLPRIYCGLHYPSDEIAGIIIGVGSVLLVKAVDDRKPLFSLVRTWYEKQPGSFYALAFLVTFQMATLFEEFRRVASGFSKLFHGHGF
jgi:undecaprenyl-diphosphatase